MSNRELHQVEVVGRILQCVVCGHDWFYLHKAQLATVVATFFEVGWLNPAADCYICGRCDYIHWFYPQQGQSRA